jgi:hypothetical protein
VKSFYAIMHFHNLVIAMVSLEKAWEFKITAILHGFMFPSMLK